MEAGRGLSRSDLACVGPVTATDTLKVLPFGKSRRQKLVVGDNFGHVTCLQSKRGEANVVFKTTGGASSAGSESELPVTGLVLNNDDGDQMFVAQGRNVRGVNKKGKDFSKTTTNLSDSIQCLSVRDDRVWVVGESTFARFDNGKETQFVNLDDAIKSMAISSSGETTILGSRDNKVRAVRNGSIVAGVGCKVAAKGSVTALGRYSNAANNGGQSGDIMMLGTESGNLGLIELSEFGDSCRMDYIWRHQDDAGAAVNCLAAYDLTKDDVAEVIVGRDDGVVQVFKVDDDEGRGLELEGKRRPGKRASLQFERSVEESVRSVQCGVVNTPGYDEVVLCTYAGNIVSFSTEALDAPEEGDKLGRSKATVDTQGKVKALKAELAQLDKQIQSTKTKLAKANAKAGKEGDGGFENSSIRFQMLQVNVRLTPHAQDGTHLLTFELPVAIDKVLLQSSVPITLLDSKEQAPNYVVSKSEGDSRRIGGGPTTSQASFPALEAVFRCTETCKRVEVKLRTIEGHYGQIKATIVAKLSPKLGQQLTVDIKPLSLHRKLPEPPTKSAQGGKLALSMVKFVGEFSLHQIHEWISSCLPDVPINLPRLGKSGADSGESKGRDQDGSGGGDSGAAEAGDEAQGGGGGGEQENDMACLWFENSQTMSVLAVRYREGKCVIESDSISAIAIMREALSAVANRRKVSVSIRFYINPETVPAFLDKMHHKLSLHARLSNKVDIIDALQEITNDADDVSFLSEEHQAVLKNARSLSSKHEQCPQALETLHGTISDLFVDMKKFQGQEVRDPAVHASLSQILNAYDGTEDSLASLKAFFAS